MAQTTPERTGAPPSDAVLHMESADSIASRPTKRLRATPTQIDDASTIRALFEQDLADKKDFFDKWLEVLAGPSICITELQDVKRLGAEDIATLPVPPLVKGLFRKVIAREAEKIAEHEAVLRDTRDRARSFLAPLRDRHNQPALAGSKYFQD